MHYSFEIPVTISNTSANPVAQILHMGSGILKEVQITFPDGCAKYVRVKLYDGSAQILPTNPDGFYAYDGYTVVAPMYYNLDEMYNQLILVAWSIGTQWTHNLTVGLSVQGVEEPELGSMVKMLSDIMSRLMDLIKGLF